LIIGVEIALSDGRVAKAGGRVVKNVAGYDLSRLVCGSFGSLAVITSATIRSADRSVPASVLGRLSIMGYLLGRMFSGTDRPSRATTGREPGEATDDISTTETAISTTFFAISRCGPVVTAG
jgi:hypothetical protein